MIHRFDRLLTELPPPSVYDPAGAQIVQELMGGKYGEMSTLMNYTFQSFNYRDRAKTRPFYELIANIAAEEYGHIELVGAAIGTMLTDLDATDAAPDPAGNPLEGGPQSGNPHHFVSGGKGVLPQDSRGMPWTGDNVTNTGDLITDLTHNYFLETGARMGKLRVYESVAHPVARALTGYLLVRGGVHQVAYARALENITGADLSKLFPSPSIPTDKIPECRPHIERGDDARIYRFSSTDFTQIAAVFNGVHPETGKPLEVVDDDPEQRPRPDDPPEQPDVFAPAYEPEEIEEIADRLRAEAGLTKGFA